MAAELTDWRDRAACREAPSVLFFPPELKQGQNWDTSAAKEICASCPVRRLCFAEALERGERHGIWGGVNMASERERRRAEERAGHGELRRCVECGEAFAPTVGQQLMCGDASCRARRHRRQQRESHQRRAS